MWDLTDKTSIRDKGGRMRIHAALTCDDCGKEEFKRYIKTTSYCRPCASVHIGEAVRNRPKPVGIAKQCLICCKEFLDKNNNKQQKYCNTRCLDIANLKNPISIAKQCRHCNMSFEDTTWGKNKKFCNHICSRNYLPNRIKHSLRSRMCHAIKNNTKSGSAVDDIGCSIEFLKKHLEAQFIDGMSWSNYGRNNKDIKRWSIDHIKALSNFELADRKQFLIAANYTNLQPLWCVDNSTKGAK